MTNREIGAAIKKELKAAGYNAKDFKVSVKASGYDTAAYITVKNPGVNRCKVENLLHHWDQIDRDERTGEVLAGCNLYLFTEYEHGIFDQLATKYLAEAKTILDDAADVVTVSGNLIYYNRELHDTKSHTHRIATTPESVAEYLYKFYHFGTIEA